MEIWIRRDGEEFGPYTMAEVKGYIATGELVPEDEAWFDGCEDYIPLEDIIAITPPRKVVRKKPHFSSSKKIDLTKPIKESNPGRVIWIVVKYVLIVTPFVFAGFFVRQSILDEMSRVDEIEALEELNNLFLVDRNVLADQVDEIEALEELNNTLDRLGAIGFERRKLSAFKAQLLTNGMTIYDVRRMLGNKYEESNVDPRMREWVEKKWKYNIYNHPTIPEGTYFVYFDWEGKVHSYLTSDELIHDYVPPTVQE